jgi:hypothetical protein
MALICAAETAAEKSAAEDPNRNDTERSYAPFRKVQFIYVAQ